MTYDQLEILEALGGVHQASAYLHKSQPAITHGKKWHLKDQTKKKEFIELGLDWGRIPDCELNSKILQLNFPEVPSLVHNIFFIKHERSVQGKASAFIWDYFKQSNL